MKPLDGHLRDQIIGMHLGGSTHQAIGEYFKVPTPSVSTTIRRYKATGSAESRPTPGRPTKQTPQLKRRALRDITDDPNRPWKDYGVDLGVSGKTVKRIAEKEGLHKRIARKKPFMKGVHIVKRLDWLKENKETDWKTIIFTDEASVEMGKKGGVSWTIRKAGDQYKRPHIVPTFKSGRQSLMIFGAIAYGHKWPLTLLTPLESQRTKSPKKVDRFVYVHDVLEEHLAGYCSELRREGIMDVRVVEDGAPIHNNKLAAQAREELHINNINHPPSSPDLNAIETLWGILKYRLGNIRPVASTVGMLWDQIQEVWDGIEQELVDKEVDKMVLKMAELKAARGHHTSG